MLFKLIILATFLGICRTELNVNNTNTSTQLNNHESNGTDATFGDNQGRSLFSDIPREGRIMNDDKISIKGFIPIVGIGENSAKDNSKHQNLNQGLNIDESFLEKYMKNIAQNNQNNQNNQFENFPQHVPRPEDQRYIGAALQGLLGNSESLRKQNFGLKPSINRKSDCVCVPFYMCKNGRLTTESNIDSYSPMYQQKSDNINHANSYNTQTDSYLPINERSNQDLNDTKFTEDILGRMLGGKSMSDGCGLLRTCCQRSINNQMIPTDFGLSAEYFPGFNQGQSAPVYRPNQAHHQQYPSHKPTNSYLKPPQGYYNPTVRPSYSQSHPQSSYRPPKLINSPSHFEPSIINPPLPIPIHNEQLNLPNIGQFAYDKCGSRQSVGINGRVQNLNYHESSTEFGEFPWQVAILKRLGPSDNLYVCGGALISSSHIITAAHCIKKFQAQDLKVRLGEWDVHREDEFYPYIEKHVENILIHPHFSQRNLANDVAILRIDTEIDFSQHPHVSPICLAEPFEFFTGQRCYVAGWGKNSFGHQGEYQSVLMKVDLPIIDNRMCENLLKRTKLGYSFRLDRSMICAGGEHGKDACEGDGGSGLVCDVNGSWKVAGLVSWGLGCGQAGVPGVYTNIGNVRNWVDKVVFPYYANIITAKSNDKNFNDLVNERSFGDDSSNSTITIINNSSNNTQTSS